LTALRAGLRRLVLDEGHCLWKVSHAHDVLPPPEPGDGREGRCREVFTAFLDGHPRAPLRVFFTEAAGCRAGYPESGVVWTATHRANLHEPFVARRLVELGRASGWSPRGAVRPFVVEGGFAWLEHLVRPTS
jgi:hypothetical protein